MNVFRREKEAVDAHLNKTIDDTMTLINQSFFQVVRQAHVLYDDPLTSSECDLEMEVYDGRMLLADEVQRLQSVVEPAPIGDADDRSLDF